MITSRVSGGMAAQWPSHPRVGRNNDPDGGADRARERRASTPVDFAQISPEARRLAASISNDADHGADGK